MEVHPPHEPIHSWPQFFLHLFTITVGLLIALGLEAAVEGLHHRHLLHQAETDLRAELSDNKTLLAKDERQLLAAQTQFSRNLRLLEAARAHTATADEPQFHWYWSDMQNSAWTTARNTGALALMPYDAAQGFSIVYGQQDAVDRQAEVYVADIYRAGSTLEGGHKLSDMQPSQLDAMIANTQQTLADIKHLTDLCHSLDVIYKNATSEL
jgi:hypothetical protein